MKKRGIPTSGIVEDLRKQGLSYKETEDTLNQSEYGSSELQPSIMEEGSAEMPPPQPEETSTNENYQQTKSPENYPQEQFFQPQQLAPQPVKSRIEDIELLVENIVEEKWQRAMESYGNIEAWKEKVRTEVIAIKQELLRIRSKLENTEQAVLGRVTKYDKDIIEIGSDVRALEKVLQNILKPLTTSIKELQEITRKLKK